VIVFLLLIVILLIGLTTAAVMGKIGGFMADPTSSQSFAGVPAGPLSADALEQLHFDQALRGYRMNQVDEVIDALGARVRELETEIASLSGTAAALPDRAAALPDRAAALTAADEPPDTSSKPRER
jgi:DivIVA domain-containing protein